MTASKNLFSVEQLLHKHVEGPEFLPEAITPSSAPKLLEAMKDVLGEAATDQVIDAWGERRLTKRPSQTFSLRPGRQSSTRKLIRFR